MLGYIKLAAMLTWLMPYSREAIKVSYGHFYDLYMVHMKVYRVSATTRYQYFMNTVSL
jgi:hypothetical protein